MKLSRDVLESMVLACVVGAVPVFALVLIQGSNHPLQSGLAYLLGAGANVFLFHMVIRMSRRWTLDSLKSENSDQADHPNHAGDHVGHVRG